MLFVIVVLPILCISFLAILYVIYANCSQKSNHFVVTVTVIMYYGFILWLEERSL